MANQLDLMLRENQSQAVILVCGSSHVSKI